MDYKIELQNNNVDLQNLINKANDLPDAVNLDAEITAQDTVISQIQEALANKSSNNGGTSVDTCTLKLVYSTFSVGCSIKATVIIDGIITGMSDIISISKSIDNVVCGSYVILTPPPFNYFVDNIIRIDGTESTISDTEFVSFIVPNKKDGIVEIEIDISNGQDV